ncbi:helix-turn-helix domain-containing protein [Microbacterium betulae]|uniref:Helix-turn-helix domain-containing protein n=1 Tax=Microbacterium betulae TaxID=2981139 RepID=A0AA97FG11_9MICO|nr:helix-turn-helix domain-containing protein [Microbacterium sp. AB]WOF22866.1 helix-turn-helix domain-containing protein [Microbacterium sp. AB]
MNFDGRVQELAERIGRPVIVFDHDFNVVAFSVHEGEIDRARLSMILSHRGSTRATEMIREHGVERADGAVLIPVIGDSPPRVVAALRYQGRLTGYVSYVPRDDEPAEGRDAPDIQALRAELGANLAARAAAEREGSDRVLRLATGLLHGDARERQSAAEELLQAGLISSSTVYAAMVFLVGDEDDRSAAMSRLVVDRALARISSITSRTSIGTVIDGEGVLVIPHEVNPQRLESLIAGLSFPGARGAGGSPRASLVDVHESRREAQIAIRATAYAPQRYGATAIWDGLGVDRLLLQLPLDRLTMQDMPDGVRRLLAVSSGADLASTLESYLDNGADAQRTARMLHIHRSTLYYRLDRIRTIVDADLSDGVVRHELHTALRVATLAGIR